MLLLPSHVKQLSHCCLGITRDQNRTCVPCRSSIQPHLNMAASYVIIDSSLHVQAIQVTAAQQQAIGQQEPGAQWDLQWDGETTLVLACSGKSLKYKLQ